MKIIGFYHMNEQTRLRFDCFDENNVGNLTQKNEALQPKTSRISHPSGHLRDSEFRVFFESTAGKSQKQGLPGDPYPATGSCRSGSTRGSRNHGEVTGAVDDTGGPTSDEPPSGRRRRHVQEANRHLIWSG